ncbi:Cyclin-dependent kinase D-1 [Metarhizium anisopliae]|nr:Cyclin-dependent kinase D-1 [Metarhizium anisopliae]
MPSSSQFFIHFLDLLKKIFVYDPANRITATQALHHPWFDEVSQPDDGTEAAKIGLERKVLEQSRFSENERIKFLGRLREEPEGRALTHHGLSDQTVILKEGNTL